MQFDGMVYQQIVGIPMGTNCAPLIADLFLYCYERVIDPLIIETTIGLVLGPCTALCRLFLKHCTLTNKAVGTI